MSDDAALFDVSAWALLFYFVVF